MAAPQRLPFGQLLGRALTRFRAELFERSRAAGFADVHPAHLQVFGNIDWRGTRLTTLAERAGMARPSMAELVNELEAAGYVQRAPDPSDRRAKLIFLTRDGRRVVARALRVVRNIEGAYANLVGETEFEAMCQTLQALIDSARRTDTAPNRRD